MQKVEAGVADLGSVPYKGDARRIRFRRYAWAVLAYNLAVIVWGAYVRATGSGAGCGNHWPLCNGEVTPHSTAMATVIELAHRVTSGLDLVLVVLLAAWAFHAFPRGHAVRMGAVLSGVFLMTEAALGAALVLLEQVARNASVSRAYSLSGHLLNTLALVACLTLTAWRATDGPGPLPRLRLRCAQAWLAGASVLVVAALGVSGVIAALGDTLFPSRSVAAGLTADFDPAAHLFLRLRMFHPPIAAIASAWLAFYASWSAVRRPRVRRLAWTLCGLVAVQLLAGLANLALLAPVWMQLVHLLLADLVWIALVLLAASMLAVE